MVAIYRRLCALLVSVLFWYRLAPAGLFSFKLLFTKQTGRRPNTWSIVIVPPTAQSRPKLTKIMTENRPIWTVPSGRLSNRAARVTGIATQAPLFSTFAAPRRFYTGQAEPPVGVDNTTVPKFVFLIFCLVSSQFSVAKVFLVCFRVVQTSFGKLFDRVSVDFALCLFVEVTVRVTDALRRPSFSINCRFVSMIY